MNGAVQRVNIEQEMRDAYLDYAMSVIVARALPDARDGLKPVHRRILYAMYDMGLRADASFKKSARVVGEVLGKYHPHGDAAVYESMVRLAQDFSMRYPLVNGQGNFGSVDGDSAAAMRYTEVRMMQLGEQLLQDIDRETVDFEDNFDGSLKEPSVLPTNIPNLLVNGSTGIAVGMSTNIPPHNLGEVCDALNYMLRQWEQMEDITVRELMQYVKGPDFPTGGLVYRHAEGSEEDEDSMVAAYATGRGKVTMRAKLHIEDIGRGKSRIIVTELPFQINKSTLIERIVSLVREGKLEGIADLRDESDRQGIRLSIELQRGVEASEVVGELFRLTQLQETFSIIILALVDGTPRTLSLKHALKVYLDHRLVVIRRRSEYDLGHARRRAHILEGLLKALENLDAVIQIIRGSRTSESARNNLRKALSISDEQAQAILDMQLRRLAALERKKIEDEHAEKIKLIAYLEELLNSPVKMRQVLSEEIVALKQTYGDRRRTLIVDSTAGKVTTQSMLMPQEQTWITLTTSGKLSRSLNDQPPQIDANVSDQLQQVLHANTNETLYLMTTSGLGATVPIQQLPQTDDASMGMVFNGLTPLSENETICAAVSQQSSPDSYLFFATMLGEVKRLRTEDLPNNTANVFKVMDLPEGDAIGWVMRVQEEDEVMLISRQAYAIRFRTQEVRPTGLGAGGMRGIKLNDEYDRVVGASVVTPQHEVWTITSEALLKRSSISDYPTQGRAGLGVLTMKLLPNSGIAAATTGNAGDVLMLHTSRRSFPLAFEIARLEKRNHKGEFPKVVFDPDEVIQGVSNMRLQIEPLRA
jgi:DNA gyrase subunit A